MSLPASPRGLVNLAAATAISSREKNSPFTSANSTSKLQDLIGDESVDRGTSVEERHFVERRHDIIGFHGHEAKWVSISVLTVSS